MTVSNTTTRIEKCLGLHWVAPGEGDSLAIIRSYVEECADSRLRDTALAVIGRLISITGKKGVRGGLKIQRINYTPDLRDEKPALLIYATARLECQTFENQCLAQVKGRDKRRVTRCA